MGTRSLDSMVSFSGLKMGTPEGDADEGPIDRQTVSLPEFDCPRVARGFAYAVAFELLAAGVVVGLWEMWRLMH